MPCCALVMMTLLRCRHASPAAAGAEPSPALQYWARARQGRTCRDSPRPGKQLLSGQERCGEGGRRCGRAGVLPRGPGGPAKPHRVAGFPGTDPKKREVNGYAALFAKRSRVAKSPVRFSRAVMVFNTC